MTVLDINQMEILTHLELIKNDHKDKEIEEGIDIEIFNKNDDKSKTKEDKKREFCQLKMNLIPIQDLV